MYFKMLHQFRKAGNSVASAATVGLDPERVDVFVQRTEQRAWDADQK